MSWLAAMITHVPSAARYRFDGAIPSSRVPEGPRTTPAASVGDHRLLHGQAGFGERHVHHLATPEARDSSAARMPCTANMPPRVSPIDSAIRGGGWSGSR